MKLFYQSGSLLIATLVLAVILSTESQAQQSPKNDSTVGSIGDRDMWIIDIRASVRLGLFDLPNVLVTTRVSVKDSWITDPFLGVERKFTNYDRGQFEFGFRHDLPRWRMN